MAQLVLESDYVRESPLPLPERPRQSLSGKAVTQGVINELSLSLTGMLPIPVCWGDVVRRSGKLEEGIVFARPEPQMINGNWQTYRLIEY